MLWAAVLLLYACGGGAKRADAPAPPTSPAKTAVPATPPSAASAPAAPAAAASKPAIADDEVKALIAEWLAAQNEGAFERYSALYAARFTGVRRTGSKTRSFERKGWLADRKRMFAKPMQVKAGELEIAHAGPSAVVRFDQEWSTVTYRDLGPKQMVLVRESGALRIAREELLASAALAAGGSSARFVTAVGGRAYVLLESAGDEPLLGKPIRVEVGAPSGAVFESMASNETAEPAGVAVWRGGPLRLLGAHGSCEMPAGALRAVVTGYPHFGVVQEWQGEDGKPAATVAEIGQAIAGMYGAWVALELEQPCMKDAVLALPPGAPAPLVFKQLDDDEAVKTRAQQALAMLPEVRKLPRADRDELLAELHVTAFGRERPEWVAVAAASGCALGLEQLALFRVEGEQLVLQMTSRDAELWSVWALADLDGDGQPEVIGSPWAPTAWLLIESRNGRVLQRADIPYNDCPC
jgi:hypothetical protein